MILIVDILPLANYCYYYFLLFFESRIVNCHMPLYPSLPFTSIKLRAYPKIIFRYMIMQQENCTDPR